MGPSSRRRRLTEVGSLPSGGWLAGLVSDGKAQEPCVVAEERNGRHPQIVGHELERPAQEVVRQAHGIGHRQTRGPDAESQA